MERLANSYKPRTKVNCAPANTRTYRRQEVNGLRYRGIATDKPAGPVAIERPATTPAVKQVTEQTNRDESTKASEPTVEPLASSR